MGCAQWRVGGLQPALGARGVLQDNFNQDNLQSKAMLARIAELEPKAVSVVTPDLAASLAAVQAYSSGVICLPTKPRRLARRRPGVEPMKRFYVILVLAIAIALALAVGIRNIRLRADYLSPC
jgi:hypothetical protein